MKNVAIIGSSGAIGRAFLDAYIADKDISNIYSISRTEVKSNDKRIIHINIDVTDEVSVKAAASKIEENRLDRLIVATGVLHTKSFGPEKSIKDIKIENFVKIFSVNTFGPALIGKYFLPLMTKDQKSIVAFLSARVGSISDNKLGGWYAYRASKSALNQIIKNFSIEAKRTNSSGIIIGLQPGTVKSKLSEPFQKNVKKGKLFLPEDSVDSLVKVIENVMQNDSGKIFDWEGEEIAS
jgi:NAD(P)-dependent dehydrogenase (short-subunit alcohol dehydrogenase family)